MNRTGGEYSCPGVTTFLYTIWQVSFLSRTAGSYFLASRKPTVFYFPLGVGRSISFFVLLRGARSRAGSLLDVSGSGFMLGTLSRFMQLKLQIGRPRGSCTTAASPAIGKKLYATGHSLWFGHHTKTWLPVGMLRWCDDDSSLFLPSCVSETESDAASEFRNLRCGHCLLYYPGAFAFRERRCL